MKDSLRCARQTLHTEQIAQHTSTIIQTDTHTYRQTYHTDRHSTDTHTDGQRQTQHSTPATAYRQTHRRDRHNTQLKVC